MQLEPCKIEFKYKNSITIINYPLNVKENKV